MVSLFKTIGEIVTKHPWAFIALWLVVLVISLPMAGVFTKNLQYDTQKFIPKSLGSFVAQDKYDEQFPANNSNQILVVVQSDNKTMAMHFIDGLDSRVKNDTSIGNVTGTSSIYSIQRDAIVNMTPDLHETLYEAFDNTSDGNRKLYNATDTVLNSSNGLYWLWDNVTKTNSQLYEARKTIADSSAQLYSVRDQIVQMHDAMYAINASTPGMTEDQVVSALMSQMKMSSPAEKAELMAIFELGPSPPQAAIDQFVVSMSASQGGVDRNSIADIYYLGRDPSDGAIGNYLVNKAVSGLKDSDSGRNMSSSDLQNATDIIHDAWNLGPAATKQDFDSYVLNKAEKGLNATEKQAVEEIWGWGPSPNETIVSSYVLREAGKDLNASENQTLAEVYGLGRNASDDTVKGFVVTKALNEMNLTGNNSYFLTLLGLDRNMTDTQLKDFARDWEAIHGYDDPMILPSSVVKNLAAGNVTLYSVSTSDLEEAQASQDDVTSIRGHIADMQKDGGYADVKVYVTGSSAMSVDSASASNDDLNNIDKVTIALVLIILGLYFRSFLTPFVPLAIIGVAVVVSMGFMGVISTQIDIYYLVMTFMVVIMLGAGTDYCVFMLSRYAEERSRGAEVKDSVKTAVEHAGKSIASSGFTAMIGFGSLTLVDQGIFRSIGIGTASGIIFAMLVALTLVPSVLTIAGDRVFWPRKVYRSGPSMTGGIWRSITSRVLKHAKLVLILALLLTVPALYIFSHLELGNDFVSMMPGNVESKVGYDLLNSEFGSGAIDRSMVVATLPSDLKDGSGNFTAGMLEQVESLSALLANTPGVDKVYSITRPEGAIINYDNISSYKGAEKEYYQSYMDNNTGKDGRTTLMYISYNGSPYSDQAHGTIDAIQEKMKSYEASHTGATLLLGGGNVGSYEYEKAATDKFALVVPVVLIGIFIILVLLLRSVFTPARLVFTLLMSISWTLAAFIIVFQFWMQASITWILPIILFCVLMGLGVDYDIFLVSRIREEVLKGKNEEEAIIQAVESTGTIITLCGAVMASAFASMLLSNMLELKEFGFVLCLAIILDATLMRLVVVPSVMVLMKKYNWWMPFVKEEVAVAPIITEKK